MNEFIWITLLLIAMIIGYFFAKKCIGMYRALVSKGMVDYYDPRVLMLVLFVIGTLLFPFSLYILIFRKVPKS